MGKVKACIDALACAGAFSSFLHALPEILAGVASFLSILWYIMRFIQYARGRKFDSGEEP